MQASIALESRSLALELHTLLSELDTARWRAELVEACRAQVARIEALIEDLRARYPSGADRLREAIDEVAAVIQTHLPSAELPSDRMDAAWADFRARLQPAYEAMANALRDQAVHVPTRRPTNYARNLLHFSGAGLALAIVHFLLEPTTMLVLGAAMAAWAWSMEIGRRLSPRINDLLMSMLGPFAHPHEAYRINSATWYCTALFALALVGSPLLVLIAIAVLGFADPVAALVGRRFGSVKLVNGRSLQGSLAFALTGVIAAATVITAARPELGLPLAVGLAVAASLFGAVAELFSLRVDDNLSIPLAAAAGAAVFAQVAGVAL